MFEKSLVEHRQKRPSAKNEENIFSIFLIALVIIYPHNQMWKLPEFYWCLGIFFLWNLIHHCLLRIKLLDGMITTGIFLVNGVIIASIVHFSGSTESLFWPVYLLPIFQGSLILTNRESGFLTLFECFLLIYAYVFVGTTDNILIAGLFIKCATLFLAFFATSRLVENYHKAAKALNSSPIPLFETNMLINEFKDERQALERIMKDIQRVMGVEAGSLLLLDSSTQELYFHAVQGGKSGVREIRLKMGEGVAGWVAKYGKAVMVNDARKDKRFANRVDQTTGFVTNNLLCAALKAGGKTLGVVEAINKRNGNFTQADLRTFIAFASQAAITIENIRLYSMAFVDFLTGAYGRRYLESWLDTEIARSQRYGGDFSLAMVDLDYFKSVNDRFGHQAGDGVLAELVSVIKPLIRSSDLLSRYGGEEFVLVFPNTSIEQAAVVVEGLRLAIREHRFSFNSNEIPITISIGLTSYAQGQPRNSAEMIRFADSALYKAKKSGRNCLVLAAS